MMYRLFTPMLCLVSMLTLCACQSAQVQTNLADPERRLIEPVTDTVDFYDKFNPYVMISRSVSVYEGEIENVGKVVMELRMSPKKLGLLSGRYFLASNGYDIPIEGTMDRLVEPKPIKVARGTPQFEGFDKPRAVWNIRDRTGGCLEGEWIDQRTGKKHHFKLNKLVFYVKSLAQSLGFEQSWSLEMVDYDNNLPDTYRFLQIKAVARPVGEETVKDQVAYRMWEDPRTGVQYPRLTRHPDPKVMDRINFLLEEKHGRFVNEILWAQSGDEKLWAQDGDGEECSFGIGFARVGYLTPTLMTVHEGGRFAFCTGNFFPYEHSVTFDLVRGEYLNWNRLSNLFVTGKDENGERPVPSPAFREWVNRQKQKDASGKEDEYGCSLDAAKIWGVYFTKPDSEPDSLVIHGACMCSFSCHTEGIVLPFSRLKPILKPEGLRYLFPEKP